MEYRRILTVQDISCLGQCSMTVALPILSACGQETCILPSAVLSTHTGGFSRPAIRDLTEDIPGIQSHWQRESIQFDAIYTGYLGSARQIGCVKALFESVLKSGGKTVVDPAMADHGKLYAGFGQDYVDAMRSLCQTADVILPNLTEAAMLAGMEYREEYDADYIAAVLDVLHGIGCKCIVLTGIGRRPTESGVMIDCMDFKSHYCHPKLSKSFHGTGDCFAAAFVGCWIGGKPMEEAARIAADFVCHCIENTIQDANHWYGTKFETALPWLINKLYR